MKDTNLRIIDVAVKYGYNSADSFSRAFHSLHGILPSEARSENTQLKAYPRMTFQLSIKGGCEMNWIGYTELDRKDKVCILKETHWRNLSCQRAERDAVTQMNLNIKS